MGPAFYQQYLSSVAKVAGNKRKATEDVDSGGGGNRGSIDFLCDGTRSLRSDDDSTSESLRCDSEVSADAACLQPRTHTPAHPPARARALTHTHTHTHQHTHAHKHKHTHVGSW